MLMRYRNSLVRLSVRERGSFGLRLLRLNFSLCREFLYKFMRSPVGDGMEIVMFDLNVGGLLFYLVNHHGWNYTATLLCFFAFSIIVSYLLGSMNTAIVVSRLFYRDDIRNHGSGNAGLTNVLRTYGAKAAVFTLLGDILKTVIAIGITGTLLGFYYHRGMSAGDGYCYVSGLFVMLGHVFPVYYKFKGGKGVLVTATMVLMLSPITFAILFTVFVILVASSKYVSLGSVVSAVLYPVVIHGYTAVAYVPLHGLISASAIILAILIVWCHRENLQRISDRTERKLSFKKKAEDDKDA